LRKLFRITPPHILRITLTIIKNAIQEATLSADMSEAQQIGCILQIFLIFRSTKACANSMRIAKDAQAEIVIFN